MGGGLAFLTKKRFNPANNANRKTVWEAEQVAEADARAAAVRAEQLRKEREEEEFAKSIGRGEASVGMRFMYAVPPGLDREEEVDPGAAPGEDAAAAAFRRMFGGAAGASEEVAPAHPSGGAPEAGMIAEGDAGEGAELSAAGAPDETEKKVDNRTALEKSVNRPLSAAAVSLADQISRFPQLKNAPMVGGMKGDNVSVNFKPLGVELRNVRCLKCGEWGHSRGDRECRVDGWNPFAAKRLDTLDEIVVPAVPAARAGGGHYGPSGPVACPPAAAEPGTGERDLSDKEGRDRRREGGRGSSPDGRRTERKTSRNRNRDRSRSRSRDEDGDGRRRDRKKNSKKKRHRSRSRDRDRDRYDRKEDRRRHRHKGGGSDRENRRDVDGERRRPNPDRDYGVDERRDRQQNSRRRGERTSRSASTDRDF